MEDLEAKFHAEMVAIYELWKRECNFYANRFLQMVRKRGGVQAAKKLLRAPDLSRGFRTLWKCGRLDLTVEALVLQEPWRDLFSPEELAVAEKKLADHGYAEP